MFQPRVVRRRIAFERDAQAQIGRRRFDDCHQIQIVLERRDRRHEDVQDAAAGFGAHRGADDPGRRLEASWYLGALARLITTISTISIGRGPLKLRRHLRQPRARHRRVWFREVRVVAFCHPRQRIEWQAIAHRRIAGHEIQPIVAQEPWPRAPHPSRTIALNRQRVADGRIEIAAEHVP
jgi:hypothetical protein